MKFISRQGFPVHLSYKFDTLYVACMYASFFKKKLTTFRQLFDKILTEKLQKLFPRNFPSKTVPAREMLRTKYFEVQNTKSRKVQFYHADRNIGRKFSGRRALTAVKIINSRFHFAPTRGSLANVNDHGTTSDVYTKVEYVKTGFASSSLAKFPTVINVKTFWCFGAIVHTSFFLHAVVRSGWFLLGKWNF